MGLFKDPIIRGKLNQQQIAYFQNLIANELRENPNAHVRDLQWLLDFERTSEITPKVFTTTILTTPVLAQHIVFDSLITLSYDPSVRSVLQNLHGFYSYVVVRLKVMKPAFASTFINNLLRQEMGRDETVFAQAILPETELSNLADIPLLFSLLTAATFSAAKYLQSLSKETVKRLIDFEEKLQPPSRNLTTAILSIPKLRDYFTLPELLAFYQQPLLNVTMTQRQQVEDFHQYCCNRLNKDPVTYSSDFLHQLVAVEEKSGNARLDYIVAILTDPTLRAMFNDVDVLMSLFFEAQKNKRLTEEQAENFRVYCCGVFIKSPDVYTADKLATFIGQESSETKAERGLAANIIAASELRARLNYDKALAYFNNKDIFRGLSFAEKLEFLSYAFSHEQSSQHIDVLKACLHNVLDEFINITNAESKEKAKEFFASVHLLLRFPLFYDCLVPKLANSNYQYLYVPHPECRRDFPDFLLSYSVARSLKGIPLTKDGLEYLKITAKLLKILLLHFELIIHLKMLHALKNFLSYMLIYVMHNFHLKKKIFIRY